MKILNLTQHAATNEQLEAGVIEPEPSLKVEIQTLITFDEIPAKEDMNERARLLAIIACS